jgi:hypothetical protein
MRDVERLQEALAAEHAAVYGYQVVAARVGGALRRRCVRAIDAHRAARDTLTAAIAAEGAEPVAALRGYVVPDATTSAAVRAFGATIERRVATVYADVVASADGQTRRVGLEGLRAAAVREAGWAGAAPTLPGLSAAAPPG